MKKWLVLLEMSLYEEESFNSSHNRLQRNMVLDK